ncbi:MAG: RNA 2',3'-cyclic phosphodiesterase [Patescibacteria group bacterium]|jgi:2'-5' RNA ligase
METKRLFISLPVDPMLSKDIIKKFSNLNLPWEKLKKANLEQMHLTLKFLGDFPIDKIPDLLNSLSRIDIGISDLELEINQSEIFNIQQPKVLALAIKKNNDLQKLYDEIDQVLFDDGLSHKEVRRFSAHLTLARVKQKADFEEFEEFNNWQIKKSFFVSYFELKESELTKAGSEYTTLQVFDL